MSYITDLGLTDWELEQAKLDELYSYDKDEPWWQRLVRVTNQFINKTMNPLIVKAGTTVPELQALITWHVKLELNQSLTAIDIYIGDDHLRIVCRVDLVDTIMENIMLKIRIPGETVICHESINLDSCYTDYTKYPLCNNGRQVNYQLQKAFGLRWMYRCKTRNHYIQTTSLPFAAAFAERHGGVISKYLTRL